MTFSKRFPKDVPGSRYPEWVDVELTDAEEAEVEAAARSAHIQAMRDCLQDAERIAANTQLQETGIVSLATALFEKRASHTVWHKEEAARIKFEREQK